MTGKITGTRSEIEMLCRRLAQNPRDGAAARILADKASDHGWEDEAIPLVSRSAALIGCDARLWILLGVLHRGIEDSMDAMAAFARARAIEPDSMPAAHGLARSAMDAGLPAVDHYDAALRIAPQDHALVQGRAAALAAIGAYASALAYLADRLRGDPGWMDGHHAFAKIAVASGQASRVTETLDAALISHTHDLPLHLARLTILARIVPPEERLRLAFDVQKLVGDQRALTMQLAVAASEAGAIEQADRLFFAVGRHADEGFALAQLRHLLRAGRWEQADLLASRLVDGPNAVTAWAYRHTAWRMTDDPRLSWLEQNGALVQTADITGSLPPLGELAESLRIIHAASAAPLDQSVRGGTQTEGALFARAERIIHGVREAVREAVDRYISALPALDPAHPLSGKAQGRRPRFAGSWSVRLTGGGRHVSHVHHAGWISSALYVALPPMIEGQNEGGRLMIGAPPDELKTALKPIRTIEPKVGHLTLFPSYAWHNVTPSTPGERLTIAFDVAKPIAI